MREPPSAPDDFPPWAATLDTPVWVTDPDSKVSWMNQQAAELLGVPLSRGRGRPCFEVVGGVDQRGRRFCSPRCPGMERVRRGHRLSPFRITVAGGAGRESWLRVLIIPVDHPERRGTWLVHCVVTSQREVRMERYLRNVAHRWNGRDDARDERTQPELTRREEEILDLLSRDESLHVIAGRLNVSYVTVRNHVQHILAKMGVHSIAEAVALRLLSGEGGDG